MMLGLVPLAGSCRGYTAGTLKKAHAGNSPHGRLLRGF